MGACCNCALLLTTHLQILDLHHILGQLAQEHGNLLAARGERQELLHARAHARDASHTVARTSPSIAHLGARDSDVQEAALLLYFLLALLWVTLTWLPGNDALIAA